MQKPLRASDALVRSLNHFDSKEADNLKKIFEDYKIDFSTGKQIDFLKTMFQECNPHEVETLAKLVIGFGFNPYDDVNKEIYPIIQEVKEFDSEKYVDLFWEHICEELVSNGYMSSYKVPVKKMNSVEIFTRFSEDGLNFEDGANENIAVDLMLRADETNVYALAGAMVMSGLLPRDHHNSELADVIRERLNFAKGSDAPKSESMSGFWEDVLFCSENDLELEGIKTRSLTKDTIKKELKSIMENFKGDALELEDYLESKKISFEATSPFDKTPKNKSYAELMVKNCSPDQLDNLAQAFSLRGMDLGYGANTISISMLGRADNDTVKRSLLKTFIIEGLPIRGVRSHNAVVNATKEAFGIDTLSKLKDICCEVHEPVRALLDSKFTSMNKYREEHPFVG